MGWLAVALMGRPAATAGGARSVAGGEGAGGEGVGVGREAATGTAGACAGSRGEADGGVAAGVWFATAVLLASGDEGAGTKRCKLPLSGSMSCTRRHTASVQTHTIGVNRIATELLCLGCLPATARCSSCKVTTYENLRADDPEGG